jgi:hypothetical protein
MTTVGLIIGVSVRPKNRAADIAAGVMTGLILGAMHLTLSGAIWLIVTDVWPIEADLEQLSEAAWRQPPPQRDQPELVGKTARGPIEQLLQKYPDLQQVPPQERGWVFYRKLRTDLIAGLPVGIWLAVLVLVGLIVPGFTVQVMAAGPLVRRHGASPAVLLPYLERAAPACVLLLMAWCLVLAGFIFAEPFLRHGFDMRPLRLWSLAVAGMSGLALTSTLRGWRWPLRLLLHAAWPSIIVALLVVRS